MLPGFFSFAQRFLNNVHRDLTSHLKLRLSGSLSSALLTSTVLRDIAVLWVPTTPVYPPSACPMSSSKQDDAVDTDAGEGSSSSLAVAKPESTAAPAERRSTLPPVLQFPLVAILSFSISSLGYSFINEFTQGELATIMRTLETPRELGIMTAWRLTELALGWFANFDSIDLAALNLLSHSPTVSLRESACRHRKT